MDYAIYCDLCAKPVAFEDLSTHRCVTPDWDYHIPVEDMAQPLHAETSHLVCPQCHDSVPMTNMDGRCYWCGYSQ